MMVGAKEEAQRIVDEAKKASEGKLAELREEEKKKELEFKETEKRLIKKDEFLDARQVEVNKEVENIKEKVEEIKKIQEKVSKIEEEKRVELERVARLTEDEAKEELLKDIEKKYEEDRINFAVRSKLLTFELAEYFSDPKIKAPLIETIISNIKQTKVKDNSLVLELDATGSLNVRQSIEGALRDVYPDGSNEKLTIEKLIAPHVEPFLKKSNGKSDEKNNDGKQVTAPINPNTATLRELQWANQGS